MYAPRCASNSTIHVSAHNVPVAIETLYKALPHGQAQQGRKPPNSHTFNHSEGRAELHVPALKIEHCGHFTVYDSATVVVAIGYVMIRLYRITTYLNVGPKRACRRQCELINMCGQLQLPNCMAW